MATAPQQVANPYDDPQTAAVYDQMRQTVSPKEFGDEVLAGASQVDPQAVAQFRDDLSQINLPPEALDLLNNMVDEILANPQQYAEIRAKYIEMGAPEELLPEQFDPGFFAAMNMAVDQMVGAPAGEQAFAKGGIAELTPVSKAIADYGRNGDTMLAHITPAEARMLRRKGGSGTINPQTGLPEFFNLFKSIGKAFKAVGNAVKSFASSTVGKIVTTVALGFFLGPAAASFMGVTSAAGVAAVSGFVGSAGATLAGGGNLSQALKAGAIGGLTAGATAGVTGTGAFDAGSYSGAGLTPGQAFQGQVDKFSNFMTPVSAAPSAPAAPAITPTGQTTGLAPVAPPVSPDFGNQLNMANPDFAPMSNTGMGGPGTASFGSNPAVQFDRNMLPSTPPPAAVTAGNALAPAVQAGPYATPGVGESLSTAGKGIMQMMPGTEGTFSEGFQNFTKGAGDLLSPGPTSGQITDRAKELLSADTTGKMTYADALKAANAEGPGFLRSYGPATALGIGAIGAFGGFSPAKAPQSALKTTLLGGPGSAQDLLKNDPRRFYIQGLPGVEYYNGSVIKPPGMATGGEVRHFYKGGITDADVAKWWSDPVNQGKSDAEIKAIMQEFDVSPEDFARSIGANEVTAADIADRFEKAEVPPVVTLPPDVVESTGEAGPIYINTVTGATSTNSPTEVATTSVAPPVVTTAAVTPPVSTRSATDQAIWDLFANNQSWSLGQFKTAIDAAKYSLEDISRVTGTPLSVVQEKYALASTAPATTLNPPVVTTVTPPVTTTPPVITTKPPVTTTPSGTTPLVAPWFINPQTAAQGTAGVTVPSSTLRNTTNLPTDALSRAIQGDLQAAGPTVSDATMQQFMDKQGYDPRQVAYATGAGLPEVQSRYYAAKNAGILGAKAPTITTPQPYNTTAGITQLLPTGQTLGRVPVSTAPAAPAGGLASLMPAAATPGSQNLPVLPQNTVANAQLAARDAEAQKDYLFAMNDKKAAFMNMGGIAGLKQGGYPRKTGQIDGPGTATSDSIPAMLSDGEFVMTAKAVRGAGKGDRRAGAKRMYALMHQLEQNAARG
jgi:hypothetical protein